MKNKAGLFVVLLSGLLFVSCKQQTSVERRIVGLDSLADYHPDSALTQLLNLEDTVQKQQEHVLRRWQLACIKAEDKSDVPFVSDSLIKIIVPYFDKHGSVAEQIEAHYYWGRTYYELHDSPRAVVGFRKVVDLSRKHGKLIPKITANACSQLSDLFWRQYDYENALIFAKKGNDLAREHGFGNPGYIMDVASCYMRMNYQDSATHYYNKALQDIITSDGVILYGASVAEIMAFFSSTQNLEEARKCCMLLDDLQPMNRPNNYALAKASFFEAFGPQDSAIYYNQQHLEMADNVYGKKDASRGLMSIYGERKEFSKAWHYAKIYAEAENSIRQMLKVEQTQNANNEFQYQRDMEAEAENERRAARAERWMLLTVGGSVVLLLGGLLFYVNRRRRLTEQLLEKEQSIARLRDEIEAGRKLMEAQRETLARREAERDSAVKILRSAEADCQPDIMKRFGQAAKGKASVGGNDWLQLTAAVENQYPGFAAALIDRWPNIKPDCLRISYLTKMGMEAGDVMRVMEMPKSSFYRKLKRLREVMV